MGAAMKKTIQIIKICIFVGILILPSLLWYGLKAFSPNTWQKLDYDLGENRTRAAFPQDFHIEDYTQQLEAYYNDNAPFRSGLISWQQRLSGALESVYAEHMQGQLARLIYGDSDDTSVDMDMLFSDGNIPPSEPSPKLPGTEGTEGSAPESQGTGETEEPAPEPQGTGETEETASEPQGTGEAGEPAHDHNYECTQELPASCLEDGSLVYTCKGCGDHYEVILPAPGHAGTAVFTQEADYTSYGYTEYQCSVCGKIYYDDLVAKRIDNSFLAPQVIANLVIPGRFGWLFFAGDDSLSYYQGTNILTEDQMAAYLDQMTQLQRLCDERGIRLQFLLLPNKEQVYPEYMPSYTIENTPKRVESFVNYVREHSDVNIIYPLQKLRQAGIYWQAYHKYDTHWTHVGAFVATQALYEALGMPTTDLHDLEVSLCVPTVNDLILLGGLDASQYPAEYDYSINYRPEVTFADFQNGLSPADTYTAWSDCGNDEKLVFIGDSFRCFMSDYLVKDFSHSVITYRETANQRTDYAEDVVESIRNADILVLEAVERYDYRLFPAIQRVIEILQNDN